MNAVHKFNLLLQVRELSNINRALRREKIPVVYLKGILEQYSLTGAWPNYSPVDIDILVRPEDAVRVKQILNSLGYRLIISSDPGKRISEQAELTFTRRIGRFHVTVDVHTMAFVPTKNVFDVLPPALSGKIAGEFFRRRRFIHFQKQRFAILCSEDMLLHQSLNFFFHHSCRGATQLSEIATILREARIDWDAVAKRLQKWDLSIFAYFPLKLAAIIHGAPVPDNVLRVLAPRGILVPAASFLIVSGFGEQTLQSRLSYRYNILLRFLILEKPVIEKIAGIMSPAAVARIIRKPRYLFAVLVTVFRAIFQKRSTTKNTMQSED